MDKFFANNAYLKEHKVNLPVIYSDNYLRTLFPHLSVPTAVLLYKGKVRAITMSSYVTEEKIKKLYSGESVVFPLKDDFGKQEIQSEYQAANSLSKLGARFTGYQDGVPSRTWKFESDSSNGLYKSSFYNMPLFTALKTLYHKANPNLPLYVPRMERVLWNVRDSTIYYDFNADP